MPLPQMFSSIKHTLLRGRSKLPPFRFFKIRITLWNVKNVTLAAKFAANKETMVRPNNQVIILPNYEKLFTNQL